MTEWYKKIKQGIPSSNIFKKNLPAGIWKKCPACGQRTINETIASRLYVCSCGYHYRIGSIEYFNFLFDEAVYNIVFDDLLLQDIPHFTDRQSYSARLSKARGKSDRNESVSIAEGDLNHVKVVIAAMDFSFIGGTMGMVAGERLARAIDLSIQSRQPFILVSRSGGARMMEGTGALMQMTRLSAKLFQLSEARIPFISVMTDPTLGGVTASVAIKGDVNIAEPNALIGYTAPKIIKEAIGKSPPKGFQRAQFALENGFLDMIVSRDKLKDTLSQLIMLLS